MCVCIVQLCGCVHLMYVGCGMSSRVWGFCVEVQLGVREESLWDVEGVRQREDGGKRLLVVLKECIRSGCPECRGCRRRREEVERRCGVNSRVCIL